MDIGGKKRVLKWLGNNLRRARKEKGYSQEKLAEISSVNLSYYGTIERGEKAITIQKLAQITEALDIPLQSLFVGEPSRSGKQNDFDKLIHFLQQLDSDDISFLNDLLPKMLDWKDKKVSN
jgi:transcriptional regulator with XRE-family HTH domain